MSEKDSSLLEHLIELRGRLIKIVLAIVIVFLCLFSWAKDIYNLLAAPLMAVLPEGSKLLATDITAPFFVPVKVTLMTAFLITLPHTLYQIWAFVAPGLYAKEKKLVIPLIVSSFILFVAGMAFAHFCVFPSVFHFMAMFTPDTVNWSADIANYLDFVLGMFMAFGVTFEVPVVVFLLVRMEFVDIQTLVKIRSYVIVGAFVFAAIFTPPDVLSQLMLALPLCLLYELGILIARLDKTTKTKAAQESLAHID